MKKCDDDRIDRLSNLPDDVLRTILSCLPTKNAFAAKILSTRWGTLFPFFWVPPMVVDIDDTLCIHDSGVFSTPSAFEKFAQQLLNETLTNVSCLDVLKLKCCHGYTDIYWVRGAFRLNARELWVELRLNPKHMFDFTNGSTNLTRLVLRGWPIEDVYRNICQPKEVFRITENFILPNLKTLDLSDLTICSESMKPTYYFNELINGCPALEVLSLRGCYFGIHMEDDYVSNFSLSLRCPLLKNLTIVDCSDIVGCIFEIDAPNLQVLQWKSHKPSSCTISSFNRLLYAHIDKYMFYFGDYIDNFLTACSSTEHLYLRAGYCVDALHLSEIQLPIYKNLKRLTLGELSEYGVKILANVMYNAPNLEMLTFEQGFFVCFTHIETMVKSHPPKCLKLHVKEIELCTFDEDRDENIKLVEYFLTHGGVLQTLKLGCMPFKNKVTLERLSSHESKIVFQPR